MSKKELLQELEKRLFRNCKRPKQYINSSTNRFSA